MKLRNRSHNDDLEVASNDQEGVSSKRSRGTSSSDTSTQKVFFLVFEDSPVQSLVNTKVPMDLESGTISVGRDPTCDIVIPDPDVSRRHAEFSASGARVMLKDLNSSNGTYVDDEGDFQQIRENTPVKLKSRVKFGTSTIVQLVRETETQYEH